MAYKPTGRPVGRPKGSGKPPIPAYQPDLTYRGKPRQRKAISQAQVLANAHKAAPRAKPGRPSAYHPDLCHRAVELGKRGKSWAVIAREFGVDRTTLDDWRREFPEFNQALTRARAACQAWWEERLQGKLGAKHFQANAARLYMAAQFDDYREAKAASAGEIAVDLLQAIEGVAKAMQVPGSGPTMIDITPSKDETGQR